MPGQAINFQEWNLQFDDCQRAELVVNLHRSISVAAYERTKQTFGKRWIRNQAVLRSRETGATIYCRINL